MTDFEQLCRWSSGKSRGKIQGEDLEQVLSSLPILASQNASRQHDKDAAWPGAYCERQVGKETEFVRTVVDGASSGSDKLTHVYLLPCCFQGP